MNREKLKNYVFSVLNVAVIAGIIAFIIIGLWKIGLVQMPDFVENIFFPGGHGNAQNGENTEYFLEANKDDSEYEIIRMNLDSESVKQLLSSVEAAPVYSHDFQYTVFSSTFFATKRVVVVEQDGVSCAYFASDNGTSADKQVVEADGVTWVNTVIGNSLRSEKYRSGDINLGQQIGALTSHKDFFDAADNPGYTFSLISDDDGTLMLISFTSVMGDYSQMQNYKLNLDYGIVTEAQCYENNKLIYSLTTNSISENPETSLRIPDVFSEFRENLLDGIRTAEAPQEEQE